MSMLFTFIGPLLAIGLVALNLLVAIRAPGRLRRLTRAAVRGLHRRAEFVEFWRATPAGPEQAAQGRQSLPAKLVKRIRSRLGIGAVLASVVFLILWVGNWVSPAYTVGYLAHLVGSWVGGLAAALLIFGTLWAFSAAWRMGRAQLFAARTGLSRVWIARACHPASQFGRALRDAFNAAHRIEVLEFTGYELIAKGPSDEGGVLAALLSRFPEKEARILLFNPCAQQIDPDRKHTTVIQSQLNSMEMSREAFESKLRATLDRIDALNRNRPRPIEVRLYSEKPSFRVMVAGEVSYLGAIDPRDAAGEFPLYEARRQSDGPSLYAAARSHLLRVWGDSVPVSMETSVVAPSAETPSPVLRPRSSRVR